MDHPSPSFSPFVSNTSIGSLIFYGEDHFWGKFLLNGTFLGPKLTF